MGVIRKSVSITTFGIVPFRSKKERIKRAEKAQEVAAVQLEQEHSARLEADARVALAERRARAAELLALQEAKRAEKGKRSRKARRQESRAAKAAAEVARERRGRRAKKRREALALIVDRLEAAQAEGVLDEVKVRGRKARKRAEALVAETNSRVSDRVVDLREKAGELVDK